MTYIIWPGMLFAFSDQCEWYGKGKIEDLMSQNAKLVQYMFVIQ